MGGSGGGASYIVFGDSPLMLESNQLTIHQGQTLILSSLNLNASKLKDASTNPDLKFIVSDVQFGYFAMIDNPFMIINTFYQKNITSGAVQFIQNGGSQAPSYSTSVSDGILSTTPSAALVTFSSDAASSNAAAGSLSNPIRDGIIGGAVSGGVGLLFLLLRIYLEKKANEYINKEKRSDKFRIEIVIPIAQAVLSQVKISGFLGYINEETTSAYVTAIIEVIVALQRKGIDFQKQMSGDPDRTRLMNQITRQIRLCILAEQSCCSSVKRYCFAEVTPQQIEDNADLIAEAVIKKLGDSSEKSLFASSPLATIDVRSIALTEIKTNTEANHKPITPMWSSKQGEKRELDFSSSAPPTLNISETNIATASPAVH